MKTTKILLVDDSDTRRAMYSEILTKEGYSVVRHGIREEGLCR